MKRGAEEKKDRKWELRSGKGRVVGSKLMVDEITDGDVRDTKKVVEVAGIGRNGQACRDSNKCKRGCYLLGEYKELEKKKKER